MAPRISYISFFLAAALTCCFAPMSLSSTSPAENPIRLISDGLTEFQSTAFSIMDTIFEDLSYASLISPSIEAIYQFGDSISDTGNYVRDHPLSNYAHLPYGETYFHKPSGRCSNGRLMIDYFADFLKLPFLDAYLNKDGNFTQGVNFAVSGATALDVSVLADRYHVSASTTNRSLSMQLGWFKSHLGSICSSDSECKGKLAKALFMIGEIGGNDYNFALYQENASLDSVYPMVPHVVHAIVRTAEEVIKVGATRVVVPGNFPIGCMPIYLTLFKTNNLRMYDDMKCLTNLNDFAKFHNDRMKYAIQGLKKRHPNVKIVYLDYYKTLKEILQHPTSYGFDEDSIYKACCGFGDNDYNFGGGGCDVGAPVCKSPEERVSWDGVHLTEHGYHTMAKRLMRDILYGISGFA